MGYIREAYFHIKGTPTEETTLQLNDNYVHAAIGYDKGKGYYWRISREGRFTVHDDVYGDHILHAFRLCDPSPSLYEFLVPCKRAGKAKEREAIELFDSNVVSAIIHRLGYDIELERE